MQRYPLFETEIGEVVLKSGNAVSTGALASPGGIWGLESNPTHPKRYINELLLFQLLISHEECCVDNEISIGSVFISSQEY